MSESQQDETPGQPDEAAASSCMLVKRLTELFGSRGSNTQIRDRRHTGARC
jgi:hypothetical protein